MLKKQRQDAILAYLDEHRYARVDILAEVGKTSEITIRRDINELSEAGRLRKVYGGAEALNLIREDVSVQNRSVENLSAKQRIAKHASSYIKEGQIIYLDAGSTTHCLIPYLQDKDVIVYTHGVHHVEALTQIGVKTHLVGGLVKENTLSAVGASTIMYLDQFRFDIAFMGTNAVDTHQGFMTPDINEAMVKKKIIECSKEVYMLADNTKFNRASNVTFASKEIPVITNKKMGVAYIDFDIRV